MAASAATSSTSPAARSRPAAASARFPSLATTARAVNSSLAIEISPAGSSRLAAGGTAAIAGTLAVSPDAGSYIRGSSYPVLTAAGGITGTFGTLHVIAAPQLVLAPAYQANEIDLLLTGFAPTQALSRNQKSTFNAMNNAPTGSATDALLNVAGNLSGSAQTHALDQLDAYSAASDLSTITTGLSRFADAISGRAAAEPQAGTGIQAAQLVTHDWLPIAANGITVWTQGFGLFTKIQGSSAAPGETGSLGGGIIGIDTAPDSATRVGASFAASGGSTAVASLGQSGSIGTYALGLYAGRWSGPLGFDAQVTGAYNTATSSRAIAFAGATATGSTSGFAGGIALAARYRLDLPLATIEPQLGIAYSTSRLAAYTESGAGAADLDVEAASQTSLRSAAGIEAFGSFAGPADTTIVPQARVVWLHQFLDTAPQITETFAATPAAVFATTGAQTGRDAGLAEAGLGINAPGTGLTFFLRYDATVAAREVDHAIRGGVALYW